MSESMQEAVDGFERERDGLRGYVDSGLFAQWARAHFSRQDIADLITAANEQRQLAIASPKLADQANALATRLSDLAERIAAILEEGA
jgi:hypothetical protein